jgi:hypothetical protein
VELEPARRLEEEGRARGGGEAPVGGDREPGAEGLQGQPAGPGRGGPRGRGVAPPEVEVRGRPEGDRPRRGLDAAAHHRQVPLPVEGPVGVEGHVPGVGADEGRPAREPGAGEEPLARLDDDRGRGPLGPDRRRPGVRVLAFEPELPPAPDRDRGPVGGREQGAVDEDVPLDEDGDRPVAGHGREGLDGEGRELVGPRGQVRRCGRGEGAPAPVPGPLGRGQRPRHGRRGAERPRRREDRRGPAGSRGVDGDDAAGGPRPGGHGGPRRVDGADGAGVEAGEAEACEDGEGPRAGHGFPLP